MSTKTETTADVEVIKTRIAGDQADLLAGIAENLYSDTQRDLGAASSAMQRVYAKVKKAIAGREVDAAVSLLSKYLKRVGIDHETKSPQYVTAGQVVGACKKLLKAGETLPEEYREARKMAYPPAKRAPRQPEGPQASEEASEGGEAQKLATVPETVREPVGRLGELVGLLREMHGADIAGFDFADVELAIRAHYAEFRMAQKAAELDADAADDMAEAA